MPELLHLYTYIELYAIYFSVHTVWAKMFRARISNCTNLFRPEPNRTRHKIFVYVRLLLSNLQELKCHKHTLTVRRRYSWHIPQILELTVMSVSCFQFSHFVSFLFQWAFSLETLEGSALEITTVTVTVYFTCSMVHMVRLRNKKCSEAGPKWRRFGPEQYQYLFRCYH